MKRYVALLLALVIFASGSIGLAEGDALPQGIDLTAFEGLDGLKFQYSDETKEVHIGPERNMQAYVVDNMVAFIPMIVTMALVKGEPTYVLALNVLYLGNRLNIEKLTFLVDGVKYDLYPGITVESSAEVCFYACGTEALEMVQSIQASENEVKVRIYGSTEYYDFTMNALQRETLSALYDAYHLANCDSQPILSRVKELYPFVVKTQN